LTIATVIPRLIASRGFGALDWVVLCVYLAALLGIGAWASRRKEDSREFFLAGRRMPVWAVAASVLATATTAATFIGGPEAAYAGNLTYLSTNIGTVLGVLVVAVLFIPAFYRQNVTTVYELLERRLGRPGSLAASWMFMVGRVFASGSRLFIAALPAAMILFPDSAPAEAHRAMILAIAALVILGVFTAVGGGIRAVIWTDVLQVCVLLLAAGAATLVLLRAIPLSPGEIVRTLAETPGGGAAGGSKLTVIDPGLDFSKPLSGFDPRAPFTLLTAITGFALLSIGAYGTDHDLTQRMLTCRSAVRGSGSALLAMLINLPVILVFMAIGLLLHIYYQRPDLMGAGAPEHIPGESRRVFLRFILDAMPPGLTGLMMAGLFAVGVGSLNSVLAAMSAALINDAYRPLRPGRSDRHYVWAGRAAVVAWGVILGAFAVLCIFWFDPRDDTVLEFVLGVMSFAYAGLVGVFLTVLCTRRGNAASAIAALATGFLIVLVLQPSAWKFAAMLGGSLRMPEALRMAFPWRLTIATAAAFLVCIIGRPRAGPPPSEGERAP
jgi:SSS family solute:Na+ symporter